MVGIDWYGRPDLSQILGWVGIDRPNLSQISGRVKMAISIVEIKKSGKVGISLRLVPTFREKWPKMLGKVEDNPDSPQL